MVDVAQAKVSERKITNAGVLHSDFTQDPLKLKVDVVFMSLVLFHIPETNQISQELFNMLHEGRKLIIVDFDKNDKINHPKVHNGFEHAELKQMIRCWFYINRNKDIPSWKTYFHESRCLHVYSE